MIETKFFGKTLSGKDVHSFVLKGECGEAEILDLGGIIRTLKVPSAKGMELINVVLGRNTAEEYENGTAHFGALIGRFANRIWQGKFTLDGKEYSLYKNDGNRTLHGGKYGFDTRVWDHYIDGDTLVLSYLSTDMEENFPGNLQTEVRYTFEHDSLVIEYSAVCDKKTIINLTNHSYFNLGGENSGNIEEHDMRILSDYYLAVNEEKIPVKKVPVADTPFDFRTAKTIGRDIDFGYEQLEMCGGYDHNYCLRTSGDVELCASVYCPETGIAMDCYTDQPGLQFYSGNFLGSDNKNGSYVKRGGFCLETQHYPDSPNHDDFPSAVLEPGTEFKSTTIYKFYIK